LLNGFVNLGLAWPFALAAPVVSLLAHGRPFTAKKTWNLIVGKGPIVLAPALWTLFLSLLPHKEERFLAVVFPIACFSAADCISQLLEMTLRVSPRALKPLLLLCLALFTALAMLLGALRCAAIVSNYGASLAIWATVSTLPSVPGTVVCVGKEWSVLPLPCFIPGAQPLWFSTPGPSSSHTSACVRYRFHSSFFMPRGATLGYLQSTFTGQLPQAFATGCIFYLHYICIVMR
jgi:alpha-1,2-mannosyltransferase